MKKGFTLIELLAVIIILALLMIVAVPNVLGTLNDAKKSTFITQGQSLYTTSEQQWVKDSMNNKITGSVTTYDDTTNKLDLSTIASNVKYKIVLDSTGKVTSIIVDDGTYRIDDDSNPTVNSINAEHVNSQTACGKIDCSAS